MALTLERKRVDFHSGSAVTAYTGSGCCCCCCCLHWIGAAVGGGIGMRKGWVTHLAATHRPLHTTVRKRFFVAIIVGFLLNVLPLLFFFPFSNGGLPHVLSSLGTGALIAMVMAPFVVFLPPALTALASASLLRRRLTRSYLAEKAKPETLPSDGSAYRHSTDAPTLARDLAAVDDFELCCGQCWAPIGRGVFVARCPACDTPIERPTFRQADDAVALSKSVLWTSLLGAFVGTVAGYLTMVLISLCL